MRDRKVEVNWKDGITWEVGLPCAHNQNPGLDYQQQLYLAFCKKEWDIYPESKQHYKVWPFCPLLIHVVTKLSWQLWASLPIMYVFLMCFCLPSNLVNQFHQMRTNYVTTQVEKMYWHFCTNTERNHLVKGI